MSEIHAGGGRDGGRNGAPAGDAPPGREALPADALAALEAARRTRCRLTRLPVEPRPAAGPGAAARYRWDADTEILVARLPAPAHATGASRGRSAPGAVELEGADGSWLSLDLRDGEVCGVQVAVWPTVQVRAALAPPADAPLARVRVPAAVTGEPAARLFGPVSGARATPVEVEVDTELAAEACPARRTVRFQVGPRRPAHAVRVGRDILLDLDADGALAGVWLCQVPPLPTAHLM